MRHGAIVADVAAKSTAKLGRPPSPRSIGATVRE